MIYLKYFPTEAEYNAFIQSEDFILPNVSYAADSNTAFYHIVKIETGDYKICVLANKNTSGMKYNMVDLGLPSGLLWADRNVGASSPEDVGLYFAWGETVGYNELVKYCTAAELCAILQPLIGDEMTLTPDNIGDVLSMMGIEGNDLSSFLMFTIDKVFSSVWSDYFDTTDGGSTFNKYNNDGGLTILNPEDDAASVHMGLEYRMPTEADFNELIDNCTVTFIDLDDNEVSSTETSIKGIKFTGSNGNSIFMPASGYITNSYGITSILNSGYECLCWGSNLYHDTDNYSITLYVHCMGTCSIEYSSERFSGIPVRGVKARQ